MMPVDIIDKIGAISDLNEPAAKRLERKNAVGCDKPVPRVGENLPGNVRAPLESIYIIVQDIVA